ncbi:phospholipid phosphatase 6-like [Odontomachus brunneus]|uniref:phospholipid phosphatase 6-like n=1 Tax=Odontomachus brunneus TaxID=486640 RepID=UPI0013F28520|nr:phospholipid phosphatase 6-like [Odontomachus brunneus]XP_032677296.1 phospholipid phosphatase 6-like [Odontomachus brunneus]XP_032677297.1 phospholipid phosphatase 6-like [Odontomachus brunneus]XP_032677298.1 phospholipid phosphatase 6-like [Odontomachus brunneus]XP_032677299.1 phospholipid phosphatase 6-like [Odontomachus brunneus]
MDEQKRKVPSMLKNILMGDIYATNVFVKQLEHFFPFSQMKTHYRTLEISCHGILWLVGTFMFIWVLADKKYYQLQVNLLLGLVLDVIFLCIVKGITRRRRPAVNDDPFSMGPDKYSFPSGHASRVTFIVYLFIYLWPVASIFVPPLLAWSISIYISRILMRRHYILDVLAGIALGILEGLIVGYVYLDQETCVNLVSWMTEEKMSGPEFDV